MNLTQLEYLVAAVDLGGLSRAAERHCVSQQAVSKAVKALESELGEQLLQRLPDGVCPTKACLALLPHARAALRETYLVARAVTSPREKRVLRLAVPEAVVGDRFLVKPADLESFLPTKSELVLDIVEDMASRCAGMVADGTVDVAIVGGRPDFDRLSCQRLSTSAARAFVGLGHPLAEKNGPIDILELCDQAFLIPRGADYSVPEIQDGFYRAGVKVPGRRQFVFPECSAYLLTEHVYRGEGVGFVDDRVRGLIDESRAKVLEVEGGPFSMSLNVVWAPGCDDPVVTALREHLRSLLG